MLNANIGYGTLDADVWFLGMEEAGGGEANLRTRLMFREVEDNADAHMMLGVTNLHWGKRKIQRTWRGMCFIMLRLEGKEPTRENIRSYQAEKLGRFSRNTLLTELMPIPEPKLRQCGYEELIPQFVSREDYYGVVKPRRIKYLRGLIREHGPRAVICYGKAFWADFKELFAGSSFSEDGQFRTTVSGDTQAILADHFTSRTMNGRFYEVVSLIHSWQEEYGVESFGERNLANVVRYIKNQREHHEKVLKQPPSVCQALWGC